MYYKLLFILLLSAGALAQTPVDYAKWRVDDTTYQVNVGGPIHNYNDGGTWRPINNEYVADGDSALICNTAVLQTRIVKSDGRVSIDLEHNDNTYTISQRLYGIGWLKMSTGAHQWIDSTMNWSNVSNSINTCYWNNVSLGVNYEVEKQSGQVHHRIIFKPAFLDSAVVLYNQRSDSLDIALANVMIYTLSSNIDDADVLLGRIPRRKLKTIGSHIFNLQDQMMQVDGADLVRDYMPTVKVEQFWKKIDDKLICVEFVPMSSVKMYHELYPEANIWHNLTANVETPDVEDGGTRHDAPYLSFGGSTTIELYGTENNNERRMLLRAKGLNTTLGAERTITACELNVHTGTKWVSGTYSTYDLLKYMWVEGTQTGNLTAGSEEGHTGEYWDNNAEYVWADFGVQCANDAGVYNTQNSAACNAGRADRRATADGSTSITTATTPYTIDCTTIAQAAGDSLNVVFYGDGTGDFNFYFTEHGTAEYRPFFSFTYTAAGGGGGWQGQVIPVTIQ